MTSTFYRAVRSGKYIECETKGRSIPIQDTFNCVEKTTDNARYTFLLLCDQWGVMEMVPTSKSLLGVIYDAMYGVVFRFRTEKEICYVLVSHLVVLGFRRSCRYNDIIYTVWTKHFGHIILNTWISNDIHHFKNNYRLCCF